MAGRSVEGTQRDYTQTEADLTRDDTLPDAAPETTGPHKMPRAHFSLFDDLAVVHPPRKPVFGLKSTRFAKGIQRKRDAAYKPVSATMRKRNAMEQTDCSVQIVGMYAPPPVPPRPRRAPRKTMQAGAPGLRLFGDALSLPAIAPAPSEAKKHAQPAPTAKRRSFLPYITTVLGSAIALGLVLVASEGLEQHGTGGTLSQLSESRQAAVELSTRALEKLTAAAAPAVSAEPQEAIVPQAEKPRGSAESLEAIASPVAIAPEVAHELPAAHEPSVVLEPPAQASVAAEPPSSAAPSVGADPSNAPDSLAANASPTETTPSPVKEPRATALSSAAPKPVSQPKSVRKSAARPEGTRADSRINAKKELAVKCKSRAQLGRGAAASSTCPVRAPSASSVRTPKQPQGKRSVPAHNNKPSTTKSQSVSKTSRKVSAQRSTSRP